MQSIQRTDRSHLHVSMHSIQSINQPKQINQSINAIKSINQYNAQTHHTCMYQQLCNNPLLIQLPTLMPSMLSAPLARQKSSTARSNMSWSVYLWARTVCAYVHSSVCDLASAFALWVAFLHVCVCVCVCVCLCVFACVLDPRTRSV